MTAPEYPRQDTTEYKTMREPPTGPAAERYSKDDNRPARFDAFLCTQEGQTFIGRAGRAALGAFDAGVLRFSVLGYIHAYRLNHKLRLNNTWAPWIADELVMRHPPLEDIIERRKRKAVA